MIAPFTTQKIDRTYPYEIYISASAKNGLQNDSKVKLDQIRVIDKNRIHSQRGFLEESYHGLVLSGIDIIFDRLGDFH